jgi:unsaturated rhamnogalacturonyl hydrolase
MHANHGWSGNPGKRKPGAFVALIAVICSIVSPGIGIGQTNRGVAEHYRTSASTDWSKGMIESTMKRYPTGKDLGSWGYAKALFLWGEYLTWKRTGDPQYIEYIKSWVDVHVDENGEIKNSFESLDSMMPGNLALILFQQTKDPRYKKVADKIRKRFDTYPRTKDEGFWHANTQSRQWQLWGDGVFMSMPFLVRYGQIFGDSAYANDEAAKQLITYYSHLRDPKTGLLFHAYDESGAQKWADPVTHHSPEFWCRAMGWFAMTLTEVLEILPANHPKRPQLVSILQDLLKSLAKYQDPKTGLWFQVVDKGNNPGNWLETSSSSMYTFAISRAVQHGYLPKSYAKVAQKGYAGVLSKISIGSDGLTNISDICEGTNVADLAYYFARKRNVNDFHGLGAFLIMNEQMMGKVKRDK